MSSAGLCRRTAFIYWAWQNTVMTHHRIKDDARATMLAERVCEARGPLETLSSAAAGGATEDGTVGLRHPPRRNKTAAKELHLRLRALVKAVARERSSTFEDSTVGGKP